MCEFFQVQSSYADTKSSIIASRGGYSLACHIVARVVASCSGGAGSARSGSVVVDTRIASGSGRLVLFSSAFAPEFAAQGASCSRAARAWGKTHLTTTIES